MAARPTSLKRFLFIFFFLQVVWCSRTLPAINRPTTKKRANPPYRSTGTLRVLLIWDWLSRDVPQKLLFATYQVGRGLQLISPVTPPSLIMLDRMDSGWPQNDCFPLVTLTTPSDRESSVSFPGNGTAELPEMAPNGSDCRQENSPCKI
jgi:hypothetical protein